MINTLKTPVIALDGHAGAGKSTVAREVARALGFWNVNSGLFYRAVTWKVLHLGIAPSDQDTIEALAREADIQIYERDAEGNQGVVLDGQDITEAVRTQEINRYISGIASYPGVREAVNRLLRQVEHPRGIIMDGRDIGTVIFPDATLKIFLTASVEERARRRVRELEAQGVTPNFQEVCDMIAARDRQDSERDVAPLKQADDAEYVDTTSLSSDAVLTKILALWAAKTR
jgi:cytidylate kinase